MQTLQKEEGKEMCPFHSSHLPAVCWSGLCWSRVTHTPEHGAVPEGLRSVESLCQRRGKVREEKEQQRGTARYPFTACVPGQLRMGRGLWKLWESERKDTASSFVFVSQSSNLF